MSMLSIVFPIQAAIPAAEAFAGSIASVARPLLGLSAVAIFLMVFKPLLIGLLRAGLLLLKPRETVEQRVARRHLKDVLTLNRMAREVEVSEPGLAAELRNLAGRG